MARYKVLKSVAHNFGHSFVSLMNYRENDYVMGHLLTRARAKQLPSLLVNILSGAATPTDLLVRPVRDSVTSYCAWFPGLVTQHQSDMQFVRAARMNIWFNLAVERPVRYASYLVESPFVCRVEIEDDRGKVWAAEIKDWWYPEATGPVGPSASRRPRPIRRLIGVLRGWWSGPQASAWVAA